MASEEVKDATAKAGFFAVWAAIAGPAGILIAALAVGIDRAWNGDAGRPMAQDRARQSVEDHRQWLAEDRAARAAYRQARRDWWDAGADVDKEPARPSTARRAGTAARRAYARAAVGWADFRQGFRDTVPAARDEWRRTGSFRRTASARPDHPDAEELDWTSVADPDPPAQPAGPDDPDPAPTGSPLPVCPRHGRHTPGPCPTCEHGCSRCGQPIVSGPDGPECGCTLCRRCRNPQASCRCTNPTGTQTQPANGGPAVTTATRPAVAGPSNVDVLAEKLRSIGRTVDQTDNIVDQLSRLADTLAAQVRAATDHANATGQATATKAALDAANQMVTTLRQLVGSVSDAAAKASDETAAARASLRPVQQAQDDIQAVGATGDAIATAKAG